MGMILYIWNLMWNHFLQFEPWQTFTVKTAFDFTHTDLDQSRFHLIISFEEDLPWWNNIKFHRCGKNIEVFMSETQQGAHLKRQHHSAEWIYKWLPCSAMLGYDSSPWVFSTWNPWIKNVAEYCWGGRTFHQWRQIVIAFVYWHS